MDLHIFGLYMLYPLDILHSLYILGDKKVDFQYIAVDMYTQLAR